MTNAEQYIIDLLNQVKDQKKEIEELKVKLERRKKESKKLLDLIEFNSPSAIYTRIKKDE